MPTLPPLPLPPLPPWLLLIAQWIGIIGFGGITLIELAMLIRVIASWFRADERFAFIRFLAHITDPFIVPCRKFIRNVGVIDFSYLLAFFLLSTLQILIAQSYPTPVNPFR